MQRIADWVWRKPVWCRVEREHVPDPESVFQREAQCLRCGRHYDDAAAHAHRSDRVIAQSRGTRASRAEFGGHGRLVDQG